MKNKLLSILLCLILVFACAFSVTLFTGCNETPPPGQEQPGDGGSEEGGETGGDEQTPPAQNPETPEGTLPPSEDSDWGVGEMPI